jgi:hydrogenase-4 component F
VTSTIARSPWLAILLGLGLLIAFSALVTRLHGLAFGETTRQHVLPSWRLAPMALHLALVAAAGIYLPGPVVAWFRHVAGLLG